MTVNETLRIEIPETGGTPAEQLEQSEYRIYQICDGLHMLVLRVISKHAESGDEEICMLFAVALRLLQHARILSAKLLAPEREAIR